VVHPGPLRAQVEFLARCDIPPGSRRAQAGGRWDAEMQAPTMEEEGGDGGRVGSLMGRAMEDVPWGRLVLPESRKHPRRGGL